MGRNGIKVEPQSQHSITLHLINRFDKLVFNSQYIYIDIVQLFVKKILLSYTKLTSEVFLTIILIYTNNLYIKPCKPIL